MLRKIRRIVTGHNAQGKSVIVSDAPSPHVLALLDDPPFGMTDLWVTAGSPADNAGSADAAARPAITLEPPRGGSIFRVVEFPPDQATAGKLDRKKLFDAMHAGGAMDHAGARHPGMHKTSTVDYAIVLTGEIYAMMDEGETLMKAGDCLIQRGTNHAWSNRSKAPCLVAFILVSANPR
ncbi:MAG TPA: cupin domain-containing protein [Methylomirabilota bacterium]|nr:cupin domain-containing protein [Methylomirabilota bacterium]